MSLSSSTRRRRHHCGQPLLHHLSILPWTQKRKSETNFYKIKCFGLCFALFAHIFLPFEAKKKSYEWKIYKYMNRWMARWTHRRHHSKNSPFKRKNKPRRLHSYKCSPKLHFACLVLRRPELLQQLWNRPTDRPTHHPANSLFVLFFSVYWSAFFTKSEQSKCMLIKSLW